MIIPKRIIKCKGNTFIALNERYVLKLIPSIFLLPISLLFRKILLDILYCKNPKIIHLTNITQATPNNHNAFNKMEYEEANTKYPFFGALSGLLYDLLLLIPAIVAFLFVYIFENLRKPILTGYVVDEVPEEILTSVLSVQSFLKTIFAAVIAFFLGLFSDLFGVGLGLVFLSTGLTK